jgi:hypothetical protein
MMAVSLCIALAACTVTNRSSETVSRGAPRIGAEGPLFNGAREATITFDTLWLREDYTRFQSPRLQAEFIYASAQPQGDAVLQSGLNFDQAADSWNLNRNNPRSTGAMFRFEENGRTVFYQPYRLTNRGWGCVALQSSWGAVAEDRRARPSNLVFGYVCDRTSPAMSPERALRIVRGLTFADGPVAANAPSALIAGTGREALIAEAQGGTGDGSTGNRAFPLRIGRAVESPTSGSVSVGVVGGFGDFGYYGGPFGYYRYPYGHFGGHGHRFNDRGGDGGGSAGGGTGGSAGGGTGGGAGGGTGGGIVPGGRISVDEAGTYPAPNFTVDEAGSYPLPPSGGGPVGLKSGDG